MHTVSSHSKGNLPDVFKLAWPMAVGLLSYTVMDITDTYLAGQLGKAELAAVGMATTVIFVFNAFFVGFFESVKILVAQATGAEQEMLARYGGWQGVFLAIPFGISFIALLFFSKHIFAVFGGSDNVQQIARSFFDIRVYASPFWFIELAVLNFYQGQGNTRTPMLVNLLICAINMVLATLLVFGVGPIPALGVPGAAMATVLSAVIGMAVSLTLFIRQYRTPPKLVVPLLKKMLKVGWPVGIRWQLETCSWAVVTSFIAHMGDDELAANQIATKIMCLSILPAYGIAESACVLTGQFAGANDVAGVRRAYFSALKLSAIVMGICGLLFVVFPGPLVALFQDDPGVLKMGRQLLLFAAVFQIFEALMNTTAGALNGTGDTRFTMYVGVGQAWFMVLPLAFILGVYCNLGVNGIWLGLTISSIFTVLMLTWRFHSGAWRNKAVIHKNE